MAAGHEDHQGLGQIADRRDLRAEHVHVNVGRDQRHVVELAPEPSVGPDCAGAERLKQKLRAERVDNECDPLGRRVGHGLDQRLKPAREKGMLSRS